MTSAGLGVDSDNPSGALALYERAGFRGPSTFIRLSEADGGGAMTVTLPDSPAIAGLRFRAMQRPSDDAEITRLVNAGMAASGLPHRLSQALITNWLDHPSNLDLDADFLFAEVDGTVVGYTEGGWEQDNDGGRNYSVWGQVHPDWLRRGLGTALLQWIEDRQRQVAASHPDVGKRLQSWAAETEAGRLALLERNGYRIVRYDFEMERPNLDDIPPLPLPDGIELRPAREEDHPSPLGDGGRGLSRPLGRNR